MLVTEYSEAEINELFKEEGHREGRIEGRREGRIEGREEGRMEERRTFFDKLIAQGWTQQDAASFVGLSV